jgi:hypothetical protein
LIWKNHVGVLKEKNDVTVKINNSICGFLAAIQLDGDVACMLIGQN